MARAGGEADELMRIDPQDAQDLALRARVGAPADVRRWLLWSAWRAIKTDPFKAPAKARVRAFRELCSTLGPVEVVIG